MPFVMFLRVPVPYWYAFCEVFECGYAFCKFFEKQVIFSIQSKALIFGKKDKAAKFQKMVQQLYLKPRPCSNSVGLDDGAGHHLWRRRLKIIEKKYILFNKYICPKQNTQHIQNLRN